MIYRDNLDERLDARRLEYQLGLISDDQFKAHLKALGKTGPQIDDEYRYQRLLKEVK